MTKIEEVARAICKAQGLDWDAQADCMTSGGGDDDKQQGYIDMAIAAITAMREPTDAMMEAGDDMGAEWHEGYAPAKESWPAMIDAALAEKPL